MLDFSDLTNMHTLVVELAGDEPSDLDNLLTESAGTDAFNVTHHRPYFVAAQLLEGAKNTKKLKAARNAVFVDPYETVLALRKRQLAYDTKWLLTIPDGYEVFESTSFESVF